MRKILFIFIFISTFVLNACSSSDDETTPKDESDFTTTPVSGKIYDSNFTYSGGYATSSISNGVDKLFIKLAASDIDCDDSPATTPLSFSCPKVVGLNTTNTAMFFKNLNNDSFVNISSGVQVEIISIGTTVKGKVKGESITENCTVNGTFEVPFCQ
jgi:hypothetical protein